MIKNYLLLALRNLLKNKVFSFINVFGLAIGLAAGILIVQYIAFELSYDQFHERKDRLYRVSNTIIHPGQEPNHQAAAHPAAGPHLKADFAEVEDFARIVHQSIFIGDNVAWSFTSESGEVKIFNETRYYDADPSFLSMFSFPFRFGDPKTALNDPSGVIISESLSKKLFGDKNPVGQIIKLNGHRPFTVTGVFVDIPENSHIKFDVLTSWFISKGWGGDQKWDLDDTWKWAEFYTYVQLRENASVSDLQAKLPAFVARHMSATMKELNVKESFELQPVADIHLKAIGMTKEREVHGNIQAVQFMVVIAILILVVAWINYVNLSTSRSIERAREVGIRKVAGANRRQLISQFLLESTLINVAAMILAAVLVAFAFPKFSQLMGRDGGNFLLLDEPYFWIGIAIVILSGALGAGLYPAIVLSSFRVVTVLKGKLLKSTSGFTLRQVLVGSQFAISIALIAGTIMVYQQVNFMRSQSLGYDNNQLLMVKFPMAGDSTFLRRWETFNNKIKSSTLIKRLAATSSVPGKLISQVNYVRRIDQETDGNFLASQSEISKEYAPAMGIRITAGRNFTDSDDLYEKRKGDLVPIILNERATRLLGYPNAEAALNQLIFFGLGEPDWRGEIVGVFSDFHQMSLKDDFGPMIFFPIKDYWGQYIVARFDGSQTGEVVDFLHAEFQKSFPGNMFEYFFLDDFFNRQYSADQQFGKIFSLFSALALIIGCLGLFGLTAFLVSQRMKEIAVRKVLGASISGMVRLFSMNFVRLILAANVIALPVVFILINRWLANFAFHTRISSVAMIAPFITLTIITFLTVAYQAVRAGAANPADVLRSE